MAELNRCYIALYTNMYIYIYICIYQNMFYIIIKTCVFFGGFLKWGYPTMDGLQGKILSKWMIWGYPHVYGNLHMHSISIRLLVFQSALFRSECFVVHPADGLGDFGSREAGALDSELQNHHEA